MAKIKAIDFANYVENCRKDLIRINKDKGILTDDNASLKTAIELTRYYDNIAPGCFTPQDDIPELPDLFKLVDEEPLIGDETPAAITVMTDILLTQPLTLKSGHIIKTSDGQIYQNTGTSSKTVTHTWDVSKDLPVASHNFKLRWIMYIGAEQLYTQGSYSYDVIATLRKNTTVTTLYRQYGAYSRYEYFDNCEIKIRSLDTQNNMPTMIMARNCVVEYCDVVKSVHIRNEELINTNNLKPYGKYTYEGRYDVSAFEINPTKAKNSHTQFYAKDATYFKGTTYLFVNDDVSSATKIECSGVGSYGDTSYIPVIEYAFPNITEDNLNNNLTFTGSLPAVNIINNINYNINFPTGTDTYMCRTAMLHILNKLKDLTGEAAKTCKFGSRNLANLTEEEIAIGTNKNWTIS